MLARMTTLARPGTLLTLLLALGGCDAEPGPMSDAGEAAAVARILELRAAGVSLVKIAARLDAEGHRPRGSRWHATSIVNVLRRAAA